jgi:hypothetical protein
MFVRIHLKLDKETDIDHLFESSHRDLVVNHKIYELHRQYVLYLIVLYHYLML